MTSPTMLAMLLLAAVCLVFRVLFVVLVPPERLPQSAHRALAHLPPVVLAALVAVEAQALTAGATPATAAYLLGAIVLIGVIAHRTHSLLLAITVSAVACLVLDLLVLG